MGNHLVDGYELFSWTENRGFDEEYGSALFKDINVFRPIFDHALVGRDGYGDWGYSLVVADDMIARCWVPASNGPGIGPRYQLHGWWKMCI